MPDPQKARGVAPTNSVKGRREAGKGKGERQGVTANDGQEVCLLVG